jgi:hypothetical protein
MGRAIVLLLSLALQCQCEINDIGVGHSSILVSSALPAWGMEARQEMIER